MAARRKISMDSRSSKRFDVPIVFIISLQISVDGCLLAELQSS